MNKQDKSVSVEANSFVHIGLQVTDEDIQNFYINILNCKSIRVFSLEPDITFPIFGINQKVTVHLASCGNIDLELFVSVKNGEPTFGHICLQSPIAERMFEKARKNGFSTFIRKNGSKETYFISDSNRNLFEIKKLL